MATDSNYVYEKGTILVYPGGGSAPILLPAGVDGKVLTFNSSSELGVEWSDSVPPSNSVISFVSPTIDFKVVGLTTAFTTKDTQNFFPNSVVFVCDTADTVTGDNLFSIGWIAADYNDLMDLGSLGLNTSQTAHINTNDVLDPFAFFPPSTEIVINVTSADSGTALTGRIVITGFYA